MKILFNISIIIVFSLTFISCGYQLRGSMDIQGLSDIRIISNERNNISKILERKLSSSNKSGVTNISKYPAIKIINIKSEKRQLSVNSGGRVDEYEIYKVIKYEFIFSEKNKQVHTSKASASYDFNESQMQGTKEKEIIATNNIDKRLVRMIILKFRSAVKSNL